jgi:hypothetical protein
MSLTVQMTRAQVGFRPLKTESLTPDPMLSSDLEVRHAFRIEDRAQVLRSAVAVE